MFMYMYIHVQKPRPTGAHNKCFMLPSYWRQGRKSVGCLFTNVAEAAVAVNIILHVFS